MIDILLPNELTSRPALCFYDDESMLSESPQDIAAASEVLFGTLGRESEPVSWPFREVCLTSGEANSYRDTLKVYDSNEDEEVRADLVGKYMP